MRLVIYAPAARMGGARAHLLGLVPELATLAPDDEVLLIAQPDVIAELPSLPSSWAVRAEKAQARGFVGRLAWEQQRLPAVAQSWGADVLLSFGSFVPLRCPCPTVLEAGNALPFTRTYWQLLRGEPLARRTQEWARWALLRASLRAAERVLAPTRAMRQDVVLHLPELADRVDVALWGVAPVFHARRWTDPPGETVLGVSKHGVNKEFDLLIAAVARLRQRRPDIRLVLTGTPEESRWSRRSAALAERLDLTTAVCWAGDVPNASIPDLIGRARVLVFPTWCESFGLPLAEALAMGAPAIAADIPACREVGADAARYYAPGDPASLAEELETLLDDALCRQELAAAARRRGSRFQWRDNAIAVRASLQRSLLGRAA
ncbi:MAG: glycosyltransferase [Chloroflexota bacterium]|nr:glycosyltransferase [Chloroflexota bacterium]